MLTGHDLTEAAARMRADRERRETVVEKLDQDEIAAMRQDMARVLETLALEFGQQLENHEKKLEQIANVILKIGEAADKELSGK